MEILQSKKFVAAIIAAIAAGIASYLDMPVEQVTAIVSPFVAYIVGQGLADIGKEKAKVENGKNES